MLLRMLLGTVLSALVMMLWGFIFWVVLSPPGGAMRAVPDEERLAAALRDLIPATGTYYFPMPAEDALHPRLTLEHYRQRHLAGPTGMIMVRLEGSAPLSPQTVVAGFIHFTVSALLASILLVLAMPVLDNYLRRLAFVVTLGVFATVAIRFSDPIWYRLPWDFPIYNAVFSISTWVLAGAVLAGVVRPPRGYTMTDQTKPLWKRALDVS